MQCAQMAASMQLAAAAAGDQMLTRSARRTIWPLNDDANFGLSNLNFDCVECNFFGCRIDWRRRWRRRWWRRRWWRRRWRRRRYEGGSSRRLSEKIARPRFSRAKPLFSRAASWSHVFAIRRSHMATISTSVGRRRRQKNQPHRRIGGGDRDDESDSCERGRAHTHSDDTPICRRRREQRAAPQRAAPQRDGAR